MVDQRFDYILARVRDRGHPASYIIRKYSLGEADIMEAPLEEATAATLTALADIVCSKKCLPWPPDRVVGYNGPEVAMGLNRIILPLEKEGSLSEFMDALPSD